MVRNVLMIVALSGLSLFTADCGIADALEEGGSGLCESYCDEKASCNDKEDVASCKDACTTVDDSVCQQAYDDLASCREVLDDPCKAQKKCSKQIQKLEACLK